jgi:hypothetical protein
MGQGEVPVTPEVEFIRRLPALVLVDVPKSELTPFGDAVRKAYADYFEWELPRVRIVVTTHGATPRQVASAIHRKAVSKNNPKTRRRKKNPYLGRHGLAHPEHPMLGLDKEQVRATKEHLRKLQEARRAGYKGSYTTDPQWLVEQAINRRGGYADDPHARGSAIPAQGRFPKKGGGDWQRHAWQLAQAVNSPRRRVYESELGEWGPELKKRLPGRFSRYGEDD